MTGRSTEDEVFARIENEQHQVGLMDGPLSREQRGFVLAMSLRYRLAMDLTTNQTKVYHRLMGKKQTEDEIAEVLRMTRANVENLKSRIKPKIIAKALELVEASGEDQDIKDHAYECLMMFHWWRWTPVDRDAFRDQVQRRRLAEAHLIRHDTPLTSDEIERVEEQLLRHDEAIEALRSGGIDIK